MTHAKSSLTPRICVLSLLFPAAAFGVVPANDNFANAVVLAGATGSVTGTNVDATSQTGEPNHASASGGRSVWWRWTATGTGVVTLDTFGSDFDTVIAVYTGPAVDALALVGEGDDTGSDIFTARVAFQATSGVTYQIAVDGFDGDTGAVSLSWVLGGLAPANDNFANGTVLPPSGGPVSGSNVNATKEPGESWHASIAGGRSVWWTWTPATSGNYTVETSGSAFDTILAVYLGNSVSSVTWVASNDDDLGLETSRLTFSAIAGTTYHIVVDGYGFESGTISLAVAEGAGNPPPNDNFADRVSIAPAGGNVTGDSTSATKEAGEPNHPDNLGGHSVWWTWKPNVSATVAISTAGSNFDTLLAVYTGSTLGSLALVAHNDDESTLTSTSYVTFDAVAGTDYQIAVDGYDGERGSVLVALNPVTSVPIAPVANPSPAVTSREFIASWTPVSGASGYRLDVSTFNNFTTFWSGYQDFNVGTAAIHALSGLTPSTNYYYRVRAFNSVGQSLSSQTIAVKTAAAAFSGLVNISTLAVAGSGDGTLVMGFYIDGTGSKTLVIRGVGPQLSKPPFGRTSVVADPRINLYDAGENIIASNDDWSAALAPDFVTVGAFAFDTGSKDAAIKVTLNPGRYTVHLVNPGPVAEGLIEIYDFSKGSTTRLKNLSCRLNLNAGQTIIVGAVQENRVGRLVIRNVGPSLAKYLVDPTSALPDPELRLFLGPTDIGFNDDWDPALASDFVPVGAFPLDGGSKDSALVPTILPGLFTVHATGKGATGVTLVELYESN